MKLAVTAAAAAAAFALWLSPPAHADEQCAPYYGSGMTVCHEPGTDIYRMCGPGIAGGCAVVPRSTFGLIGPPGIAP